MFSPIVRPHSCRTAFSSIISQYFSTKCQVPNENKFTVIYRFPYITACSLLNKYKKFQLFAAGTAAPGSAVAHWYNLCDGSLPATVTTVAVASTVAVFSIGQLFTDFIGYVYYNEDKQEIKISYLDFWGRRKNVVYGMEDFLPLSNSPRYITDSLFRRVYLYSSRHPFKLSIKHGEILDHEIFRTAFCNDELDKNTK